MLFQFIKKNVAVLLRCTVRWQWARQNEQGITQILSYSIYKSYVYAEAKNKQKVQRCDLS